MTNKNPLNFTKVDFDTIEKNTRRIIEQEGKQSIYQHYLTERLREIFIDFADFTNFGIERTAEESFFRTLRLQSSAIMNGDNLGYVPARPLPAKTKFKVKLKKNLQNLGIVAGDEIVIRKYWDQMTHDGKTYVSFQNIRIPISQEDINNSIALEKEITGFIDENGDAQEFEIHQGFINIETITDKAQVSEKFQQYQLPDKMFSDYAGERDLGYDETEVNLEENLTRVIIHDDSMSYQDVKSYFDGTDTGSNSPELDIYVNRRSLFATESIGSDRNVCLISSNPDQSTYLLFGDGQGTFLNSFGITNLNQNISYTYFKTEGASAIKYGVVGDGLEIAGEVQDINGNVKAGLNPSSIADFILDANILGGSDFESAESIKVNAPEIYQALERAITSRDTIAILKALTSPIDIKNAYAWGENEYVREVLRKSDPRYAGVSLFCVMGSMYNIKVENSSAVVITDPVDASDTILEGQYDAEITANANFYYYSSEDPFTYLRYISQQFIQNSSNVEWVTDYIDRRSAIGTTPTYMPSIVQQFNLVGDIVVRNLSDKTSVRNKVLKDVYTWLDTNIDYNQAVNISEIMREITNNNSVISANVRFDSIPENIDDVPPLETGAPYFTNYQTVAQQIIDIVETENEKWFNSLTPTFQENITSSVDVTAGTVVGWSTSTDEKVIDDIQSTRLGEVSERTFYYGLAKNIYQALLDTGNSDIIAFTQIDGNGDNYFTRLLKDQNLMLKDAIRSSMISQSGNIEIYSMKTEIVQVNLSSLNFIYGS